MAVRKRFFTSAIAKKIKQDLVNSNTDLDFIKTVAVGDLYLMPSPEELSHRDVALQYLPAIYIMPSDIFNSSVNQSKSISSQEYTFTIKCVHYYDINDTTDMMITALETAELVAETLLEDKNFEDTTIVNAPKYIALKDKNDKVIGNIIATEVGKISVNELDTEFFKTLGVPVIISEIEYCVLFRSLHEKGA